MALLRATGFAERKENEGKIIKIACSVGDPVVPIESPGIATVALQRVTSQKIQAQRHRITCAGKPGTFRLAEYIDLPGRNIEPAKIGAAHQIAGIERFMKSAPLPVDAMREPERHRLAMEPVDKPMCHLPKLARRRRKSSISKGGLESTGTGKALPRGSRR